MARNKSIKQYDDLMEIDFSNDMNSPGDEVIAGMMNGLVEASNHQQKLALELTKLIVEKSTEQMTEEEIFLAFKRSQKAIADNFPLKELWEKFS